MMDECVIQIRTDTENEYGEQEASYTDGTTYACGLRFMSPRSGEEPGAEMTVTTTRAFIRLPRAAYGSFTERDRIKVTKRYGEALGAPLVFDVAGPVQVGPSGLQVEVKRVEH